MGKVSKRKVGWQRLRVLQNWRKSSETTAAPEHHEDSNQEKVGEAVSEKQDLGYFMGKKEGSAKLLSQTEQQAEDDEEIGAKMNALDANLKAQSENKGSRVEIGSDVDDTKVNVVKVERAVSDEQIGSESLELTKSLQSFQRRCHLRHQRIAMRMQVPLP